MPEFTDKPKYAFGPALPPEIGGYLKNKTVQPSFSWLDVEPEEHAVQFAVAKATSLDVLGAIKDELVKAQSEGLPFDTFKRQLRPRLEKLGWWGIAERTDPLTGEMQTVRLGTPRRLKTIYDANLRTARAAGEWQRIQRTKAGLPYLLYELGPSENHRPHHVTKAGIILPVDDPFWRVWYPPNGWGCKCRVRQITRREAERRGGATESPEIVMRDWVNNRTGEVKSVAEGIDPGWDRNPGIERQRWAELHLQGKLEAADEDVARTLSADLIDSWRFQRVHERSAAGRVPVAVMPNKLADAIGAQTRVVSASDTNADKVARNHPEVTAEEYKRIQTMLDGDADIFRTASNQIDVAQVVTREDGRFGLWVATIRAHSDGSFLTTFFRSSRHSYLETLKRRGGQIR